MEEKNTNLFIEDHFVVPDKKEYQKAHDSFMEKIKKEAHLKKIAFRVYLMEYLKGKLEEISIKIMKTNGGAEKWAKEAMKTNGNICGPLLNEIAVHFWISEKIPVFTNVLNYGHGRLAVFVGNIFDAKEMKSPNSWLAIDLKIRDELHNYGQSMKVTESELRKIFKDHTLEKGFLAYVKYVGESDFEYSISLPKEYRSGGKYIGEILNIETPKPGKTKITNDTWLKTE